jgi:hypothetical protein
MLASYRDLGLLKVEHAEEMEIWKMLSLEELRNYVITQVHLRIQNLPRVAAAA